MNTEVKEWTDVSASISRAPSIGIEIYASGEHALQTITEMFNGESPVEGGLYALRCVAVTKSDGSMAASLNFERMPEKGE